MFICKKCSCSRKPKRYVSFWVSEKIIKANARDPIIPKYGYHLGLECADCGAYNGFIKQTEEMLFIKFYETGTKNSKGSD